MNIDKLKSLILLYAMDESLEWARYVTVDEDGDVYIWEHVPENDDMEWMPNSRSGHCKIIHKIKQDVSEFWKHSLVELT